MEALALVPTTAPAGRILVVDDDSVLLRSYQRALRAAGYTVSGASDGAQAMDLFREGTFDAVVSDLDMPGLNGLQLMREIRQRDLDVPVIIVTGGPTLDSAVSALEHGALRYLTKPVDPSALEGVVRQAVSLHRLARLKRAALEMYGGLDRQVGDRAGLQVRFESALENAWVALQPIVRWSRREVFAYEALVRSRETTLPHPGALFDAAERLDRLWDLGRQVRRLAVESFAGAPEGAQLFVNLHTRDLNDETLYDPAAPLTRIASRVVLEITERDSLDQVSDVRGRIATLRQLGFRIALDDMGAGYAGLTSFALLEPDVVKVDMTLVRDVHREPTKQRLVRALTELCASLGLPVVAEGIESAAERDALVALGCDLFQGFHFARPGPGLPAVNWG